ncbi:MAG: 2-phospho-L-lactate guanylyltransferase [Actinomycetota bacterium]
MKATAILPVKRFAAAKQRLGTGLDEERRLAVIEAMLRDVIEAIASARMLERTIVVSGEPAAVQMGEAAGATVIADPADEGHPEAALLGVEAARAAGARCVALLPGDCPLLDPRELDRLLTGVPEPYVAIAPDRHGTGTNALVLSPPDAIRPAFGEGSCQRHVELARSAGISHGIERLDSLALDLDTPADMVALTRELEGGRGTAPHTARALGI